MPNALRIRGERPASLTGVRGGSVWLAWLLLASCSSSESPRTIAKGEPAAGKQAQPAATAPADRAWLAEVQRRVAADEYRIRPQGRALAAGNRNQGLSARWSEEGLTVASRMAAPKSPTMQLAAVAIGRGESTRALGGGFQLGACRSDGARGEKGDCLKRVERQTGDVVEWWENRPGGLEQGFVISKPVARPAASRRDWVRIDVAISGARIELARGSSQAVLVRPDGQRFLYAGLAAWDAEKTPLPVRMRKSARRLTLEIDDSRASYPIVVDPVLTQLGWNVDGDEIDAGLEMVVAGAGNVNGDGFDDVVVGFPRFGAADEGRVLLYLGAAAGPATTSAWDSQGANVAGTAPAATAGSLFGASVASAGDVNGDGFADLIVGQPNWSNVEANEGRAYVFHGSAGATPLPAVPNWVEEGGQANALMGQVSGAGDINADGRGDVVVGSPSDAAGVGRVLVYLGSATGLAVPPSAVQTITATGAGQRFGSSVASAGDTNGDGRSDVIVGASSFTAVEAGEGAAFAYLGQANGTLLPMAGFPFQTNEAGASVTSVAGAGDVNGDGYADAVAGSPNKDNGQIDEGVVFFFAGSAAGLSSVPATTIDSNVLGASFGQQVAGPGDVNGDGYADIAASAHRYPNGLLVEAGAVFLIPGGASGPTSTDASASQTILFGAATADNLGLALGAAGDVNGDGYADVIAGAPGFDGGQNSEGRAFLYLGSGNTTGLRSTNDLGVESGIPGASLGLAGTNVGDVNGDGFADVVMSGPGVDTVWIYHGGAGGPNGTVDGTLMVAAGGSFGEGVAAGDVNGDGFSDLIVGAPNFNNGLADEGQVFVYPGSAGGITGATVPVPFDVNIAGALLGSSVAATDVNGDGFADVVAGAPGIGAGRVYLLLGGLAGVVTATPVTVDGDQAGAGFGSAVASAGDVNGDGLGDVVVGAPFYDSPLVDEGRIYVYHGAASGFSATISTADSNVGAALLGSSVGGNVDVNGDGFSDVIAGAPDFTDGLGQGEEGAVFVYNGSLTGIQGAPFVYQSDLPSANLGSSVSGAGSLNGDVYGDIVVGAAGFSSPDVDEGAAFVFVSTGTGGLPATPSLIIEGNSAGGELGAFVTGGGDVNGDGTSDVVLGSPTYEGGQIGEGRFLVHLGNTNGRPSLLRVQRPAVATIVQPGSVVTASRTAFDLAIRASSPTGVSGVKFEYEVKPLASPFTGTGTIVDSTFTNTGLLGVDFTRSITGLTSRTPYHYRARLVFDPAGTSRVRTTPWLLGQPLGQARALALRTDGIAVGTLCSTPGECSTGFCVDGVCCATACGGGVATDCQACSATGGSSLPDGICGPRAVGATCNDSNLCTNADTCNGVLLTCVPGAPVVCADEACRTAGACNPATGLCVNPPRPDGTVCDDLSVCTNGTTCTAGVCGSAAVTCVALSPCHDVGTCDAITGVCSNPVKANGAACSDGNSCTQTDTCQAGTCTGANPVVCPAPDQCHDLGTCVVGTGLCSNPAKADLTACNDGNMCTTLDRCVAGACVMGGILDCNDNDLCTADTCVAGTGCVRTPVVGCGVVVDAGPDAATDASDASSDGGDGPVSDGAVDRSLDVVASDARDAARDTPVGTVDGAATDASDAGGPDRVTDGGPVTDATSRDTRDGAATRFDGGTPAIKRVGGGGGCDCDVGRRGPGGTAQAMLLLGFAMVWFRRRSRKR